MSFFTHLEHYQTYISTKIYKTQYSNEELKIQIKTTQDRIMTG